MSLYAKHLLAEKKNTANEGDKALDLYSITKANFSGKVQEYLLAQTFLKQISTLKAEVMKGELDYFRTSFGSSTFLPVLEEKVEKWSKIAPGIEAPDFKYVTPEGKEVALSDLKGKLVYIDLWATWCKPCLAEMPYAKKLGEKFEGQDDVVFMYVSMDKNEEAWRKYMEKNKEPHGLNLFANGGKEIGEGYMISGIPTYILIGKDGKIISARAPRPSSGEVEGMIEEHLNENS